MRGIRETIEELGGDADEVFRVAEVKSALPDPDAWMSYRTFLLLLEQCARATQCRTFGLELSRRQDLGILGAVGFAIQQAPDVRTALRELSTHIRHHNQGADLALLSEDDMAHWVFTSKLEGLAPVWQQADLVAGIGINIMRLFLGQHWFPVAVYVPHSAPQDTRPYKSRFNCPIFFNWHCMQMSFPAKVLDCPIEEADPLLFGVLEEHLRNVRISFGNDYLGQVKHLIHQALNTGDCSVERVASFLAVNKRTLQRRLKQYDTSYTSLLEEVRFNVARRYLSESSGSLSVLAEMLCYSELSVFSNAFRRHHGVSPRVWKQRHNIERSFS
jgi:AraC-like DNA-binding protein